MRVQRIANNICGVVIGHSNDLLIIKLDNGIECKEHWWYWLPLDNEARTYLEKVEQTIKPAKNYRIRLNKDEN